jgi:hypothetical protein
MDRHILINKGSAERMMFCTKTFHSTKKEEEEEEEDKEQMS